MTVPPDADRVLYPCFMPEWLPTDLTQRTVVHGVAAVPDPKGTIRYLTKPADAFITMIMEGALLKVATEASEPTLRPGQSFDVPVIISPAPASLPIPVTIELIVPEELSGLLHAKPLVLLPGTDRGTLHITSKADTRLRGSWSFTLTATALPDARMPVISQTDLSVAFREPSGPGETQLILN